MRQQEQEQAMAMKREEMQMRMAESQLQSSGEQQEASEQRTIQIVQAVGQAVGQSVAEVIAPMGEMIAQSISQALTPIAQEIAEAADTMMTSQSAAPTVVHVQGQESSEVAAAVSQLGTAVQALAQRPTSFAITKDKKGKATGIEPA